MRVYNFRARKCRRTWRASRLEC